MNQSHSSHLADVLVDELMLLDRFLDEAAPPMNSRRAKPQTLRKQQQSSASVTVLTQRNDRAESDLVDTSLDPDVAATAFFSLCSTPSLSLLLATGRPLERVPQPLPGAGTLRTADEDIFE